MADVLTPKLHVTVGGKKLAVSFDLNTSPTKKGIVMYFVQAEDFQDPRDQQELANKISVWLQKKLGEQGLTVTMNDRNAYSKNTISFIVPLVSIVDLLLKLIKGA